MIYAASFGKRIEPRCAPDASVRGVYSTDPVDPNAGKMPTGGPSDFTIVAKC